MLSVRRVVVTTLNDRFQTYQQIKGMLFQTMRKYDAEQTSKEV